MKNKTVEEIREEIAYKIYMVDRSQKSAMPFREFVDYPMIPLTYIGDCKKAADSILSIEVGGEVEESKVSFSKDNQIPYFQDMQFLDNIPSNIIFDINYLSPEKSELRAYGYGIIKSGDSKAYGNGSIYVLTKYLPKGTRPRTLRDLIEEG
jgi:hypothetical protein